MLLRVYFENKHKYADFYEMLLTIVSAVFNNEHVDFISVSSYVLLGIDHKTKILVG